MCNGTVNEPIQVTVKCVGCGHTYALTVEATHLHTYLYAPRHERPNIQDLFTDRTGLPYLSADERELLLTQTCGDCFDALFADTEAE